jgi:DNA-binding transcriptional LysR family regulator
MLRILVGMNEWFARSGLSIDRLRSFLAVVDAGGFAAAAPGDIPRQQQLSRQIGELEDFFQVKLIERSTKGIALTAHGRELAVHTRESLARFQDFSAKARSELLHVRIGCGESVYRWWLSPCADTFGAVRACSTMMSGPEVIAGLFDSALELGFVRTSDLRRGLRARQIGEIEYALYVPKSLVPDGKLPGIKQLLEVLPLGTLTGEPGFTQRLETALARAKVKYAPIWLAETFPQLADTVAKGHIAAVLPTLARAELPSARFHELKDPIFGKHDGRMNLAWMPRLERQRPDIAALVPRIVARMQAHRS